MSVPFDKKPIFSDWKITTAQGFGFMVKLNINNEKLGYRIPIVGCANLQKQLVAQKAIQLKKVIGEKRIAHVISDIICQRITGESGYFDSETCLYF